MNGFLKVNQVHSCMVYPEGEKHWALLDFVKIAPGKSFSDLDAFCDKSLPLANLTLEFGGHIYL